MSDNPLLESASNILLRAVELEGQNKLTESLICYQESIGLYLKVLKSLSVNKQTEFKERLKKKIEDYISRAENVKELIKKETAAGKYHEQIIIRENASGYGYKRIFSRFLEDGTVATVWVQDPYIRTSNQIENFSHFCEVLLASNAPLRALYLETGLDNQHPNEQLEKFEILKRDLEQHNISFKWNFSDTLHDREVRFDNGWIVKIGRGLDYIRRPPHKFCGLGVHDYDFRPCAETTIDIFHSSQLRK